MAQWYCTCLETVKHTLLSPSEEVAREQGPFGHPGSIPGGGVENNLQVFFYFPIILEGQLFQLPPKKVARIELVCVLKISVLFKTQLNLE